MEYKINDTELAASTFIPFVNQIWQGDYDMERTQAALSKTLNITAYEARYKKSKRLGSAWKRRYCQSRTESWHYERI